MTDLLDRRQRAAALLLLTAIDLPVEMRSWGLHVRAAAKIMPGAVVSDMAQNRIDGLERARAIIDEMLAETPQPAGKGGE